MTLFKQLSLLMLAVFITVILVLSWGQLSELRSFLYRQMQSELDNSSQALSLMLQPYMEQADRAGAETMITAMFEGGLYQSITLTWLADGSSQSWQADPSAEGVPHWFRDLPLFVPPTQQRPITSGWLQLGELEIQAHPGYGYRQLWNSLQTLLWLCAGLFLLMLTLAKWGLRRVLHPLEQVRQHAARVAEHQFGCPIPEPRTQELAAMVRSINTMEHHLKLQFDAHKDQVNALQHSLLTDPVSSLPNRQHLQNRLSSWLQEGSDGALFLLSLPMLEQIRAQFGYQLRDEALVRLADALQRLLQPHSEAVACRISAHEFVVVAESLNSAQQQQLAEQLQQLVHRADQSSGLNDPEPSAIGAVRRQGEHCARQILAESDQAMRQARTQRECLVWYGNAERTPVSLEQWRQRLTEGLQNPLALHRQPVMDGHSHQVLHWEVFGRLRQGDQEFDASRFLPYLVLLGKGAEFDRSLITQVLALPELKPGAPRMAINLTSEAIQDAEFGQWLIARLQKRAYPVQFEISEQVALHGGESLMALRRALKEMGYPFGVDHFGRALGSLDYLEQLAPDYLRLDHAYGRESTPQQQQLCRALCLTAYGLQIEVFLCGVESVQALQAWQPLELTGYQGFIHPPQPLQATPVEPAERTD
ncbi:bifunctional diguanylate cyclase/phosphodiesterase [Ferrimonas gelatinilytica]|uniref:EAL domain-containing protein n=1 Tax=Ferrimonas gelatinilytica TaxID=1255257 RepID=A0ABP9RVG0_9GAMM